MKSWNALPELRQHGVGRQIEAKRYMGVRHGYVIVDAETWSVQRRIIPVKLVTPK